MKKYFKYLLCAFFVICTVDTSFAAVKKEPKPINVSIIQLISNPKQYHKKIVFVVGYYRHRMESSGLYLSHDDAYYLVYQNSIWMGPLASNIVNDNIESVNDSFVEVQGTFYYDKNGSGHFNGWPGEIKEITHFKKRLKSRE
jgi:hypothetical protein